jgi:hypothetical protein
METEVEQGHENIIIHENSSKYDVPWIKEYVIEERNRKKTWEEIANGLKERGMQNVTAQKCSTIWKESLARTMITSSAAKEDFIDFTNDLRLIYGDSIKLMGEYVKTLRNVNEELSKVVVVDEEGKVNVLQTQMAIAKQIPLATGLMKEVREYVKNQISLYDTIQKTGEEDIIWNEERVIGYLNTFLPTYLKQQEEIGTIKILDKSILKS